jgi:hypothetical protein
VLQRIRGLPEAWREAGLIFLVTRGALFLLAPFAYLTLPKIDPAIQDFPPYVNVSLTDTLSGLGHYLFDIWAKWDSVWYLHIAQQGYSAVDNTTAFFPLYPLLLAALKPLFLGNGVLAGMFISLLACLVAFYLFYRFVSIDFGGAVAKRSLLFLAIFPTSFFFQTVYSESLFLALTIGCLYAARRREFMLAGLLGALATLTRSAGLLLLIPLFMMYFHDRDWNWRRTGSDILYLLLVPLGLLVWMLYLDIRFGDPFLFTAAQSNWLREFAWPLGPLEGLRQGVRAAWNSAGTILGTQDTLFWPVTDRDPRLWATYDIINLGFTVSFLALSIAAFWRLPKAYAAYALAAILLPLSFPSAFVPLLSMPRFALTAFPVFILLALWAERHRWVDLTVTVTSLVFLGFFTAKFVVWTWVA